MVHSHSRVWVRLLGLGLALGLMCSLLPAYAFAEEPLAEGSAAAQSAETETEQAAPETQPEQAQPETEAAQAVPETETAQPAPEPAQAQPAAEAPSNEAAVEPAATDYSGSAAIYYKADPAGNPLTNDTTQWAPAANSSTILAQINTTGATWESGSGGGGGWYGQNITQNVAKYITAWPDGSKGDTWTVKRDDAKTGTHFTYILDSIWDAYQKAVKQETGEDVEKDDVTEITLTPCKISSGNGGTYEYHLDCALSVTCTKMFTAKFWVKEPGGEYKQVDAKNYRTDDPVQYTANVNETYTDANGKTYRLDGWYVEDGTGSNPSDTKAAFPHTPTDAQLTDGVVNYYAHYVPVTTSVTVTKQVTGPMGDRNKKFTFQWSCGGRSDTFTLSNGESYTIKNVAVGEALTLTESDNSGYAVSVTYNGQNCTVDAQSSVVTITVAQDGGPITVTNYKDVNPDTGITLDSAPYVLALGLTAVTAAVLLYRRSRRRG